MQVPTCIVDYSSLEQTDAQLEVELDKVEKDEKNNSNYVLFHKSNLVFKADVVCVVYAVDDEDSLDSVTEHWLPLLRYLCRRFSGNYKKNCSE